MPKIAKKKVAERKELPSEDRKRETRARDVEQEASTAVRERSGNMVAEVCKKDEVKTRRVLQFIMESTIVTNRYRKEHTSKNMVSKKVPIIKAK